MALDPRTLAAAANFKVEADPERVAHVMKDGRRMAELKDEIDELNAELKQKTEEYDRLRKDTLPETMNEAGLVAASGKGSFTLADGRKIFLQGDLHAHVIASDREIFHAWLRKAGHGDLIKETVHPSTLKAFVKEQLSQDVVLPDFIQAAPYLKAVLRKA